jgi:6-phosphogluconolactonase
MIRIFENLDTLSHGAAELFVSHAEKTLAHHSEFNIALSGGHTPTETYRLLASSPIREQVDWKRVHIFFGDERWVPSNDPRSNALMASQALLDHVPIPPHQIHPMCCADTPEDSATKYEALLQKHFVNKKQLFDFMFLGLGENGHTASLFPNSPVLHEKQRWVCEMFIPELQMTRLTLTPWVINRSEEIIFLVSGSEKADVLQQVLEGPYEPETLPAQLIHAKNGELLWLIDRLAAKKLSAQNYHQLGV